MLEHEQCTLEYKLQDSFRQVQLERLGSWHRLELVVQQSCCIPHI
jgi:hypothetical protein